MCAAQTFAWRGPPLGPLVTRPLWTRCQYHCFDLHQLVGECTIHSSAVISAASQLTISVVLLGVLALHLPYRQLDLQLGMPAVPPFPGLCASDVSLTW